MLRWNKIIIILSMLVLPASNVFGQAFNLVGDIRSYITDYLRINGYSSEGGNLVDDNVVVYDASNMKVIETELFETGLIAFQYGYGDSRPRFLIFKDGNYCEFIQGWTYNNMVYMDRRMAQIFDAKKLS